MPPVTPPKPPSPPPSPRFASSSGPVNRRTVRQPVAQAPAPLAHASLRQRMAQVQTRRRLGRPLSERLAWPQQAGAVAAGPWAGVFGDHGAVWVGLALALGGLGWLLASWWWLAGAVVVLAGAGWVGRRAAGQRAGRDAAQAGALPLFDGAALARLDEALHHRASEMTEAQLAPLRTLADTLERMVPLMRRVGVNELFTQEDHFYVTECVRRYLPDTLQAYLQVPRHSRALPAEAATEGMAAASADQLLAAQLALLQAELTRREQALARASTEALQRQQRFLQAKGARD